MSVLQEQHARWAEARGRLTGERVATLPSPPKPRPKPVVVINAIERRRRLFKGLIVEVDGEGCEVLRPGIFLPQWKVIALEVCAKHDVTIFDLVSHRRDRKTVNARHEAIYRCRHETSMSLPQIGKRFGGRDHTTALHSIRKHTKYLAEIALGERVDNLDHLLSPPSHEVFIEDRPITETVDA